MHNCLMLDWKWSSSANKKNKIYILKYEINLFYYLDDRKKIWVCVDVYIPEIQTNCKEIALQGGNATTANIGTFTFQNVPVGTNIKACIFDPTSNSVDDYELTSNSPDKNQK
jgi:hypothetical protein